MKKVSGSSDVDIFKDFLEIHRPLSDYPALQNLPRRSFFESYSGAKSLVLSSFYVFLVVLGLLIL